MANFCLTLICPPTVEERLLDTLLTTPGCELFTSHPTYSHGMAPDRLSTNEQVLGRSRSTQVQVLLDVTTLGGVLDVLRDAFSRVGIRYWVTAVPEDGEL